MRREAPWCETRLAYGKSTPRRPRLSARTAACVIGRRPPRPRPLDSIPGSGFRPGTVAAIETTNVEPQGFMGGVVQPPRLPPAPARGTGWNERQGHAAGLQRDRLPPAPPRTPGLPLPQP